MGVHALGDDLGAESSWRPGAHPPVEDQRHRVRPADVEVVADESLEERPARRRAVEHHRVGHLELPERQLVDVPARRSSMVNTWGSRWNQRQKNPETAPGQSSSRNRSSRPDRCRPPLLRIGTTMHARANSRTSRFSRLRERLSWLAGLLRLCCRTRGYSATSTAWASKTKVPTAGKLRIASLDSGPSKPKNAPIYPGRFTVQSRCHRETRLSRGSHPADPHSEWRVPRDFHDITVVSELRNG